MDVRRAVFATTLLVAVSHPCASGQQVFERDVEIKGPRGNTIDRHTRIERSPGSVTREIDIRRPDGVLHRSVTVPTGRPPVAGPRSFGGPVFVERDVIVNRGGGLGPVGSFAVPFVGGLVGAAVGNALTSPRPTPVVVGAVPAPAYVPAQPVPVPAPIAQAAPGDLVPTEVERLKSWNGNTRVEAAMVLGKLGDPRAVPHLVHTLRDDHKDEVREYSAWALGMIGDPQGRAYLEVASTNDSKRKVRDAALKALARMDQVAAMPTPPPSPAVAAPAAPTWAARTTPAPSATNSGGGRSYTPPPPPEPVLPSPPSP